MLLFTFMSLGDIQRWGETQQENPKLVPSLKEIIQVILSVLLAYQRNELSDLNNVTTNTSAGTMLQQWSRIDNKTWFFPKMINLQQKGKQTTHATSCILTVSTSN